MLLSTRIPANLAGLQSFLSPANPPLHDEFPQNADPPRQRIRHGDGLDGEGAWARLPAAAKQQLRDSVFTLLGQIHENRKPFSKADAQSILTPTLFIGGADTKGLLPAITRALAPHVPGARTAMIEGARHWMFEQAPQEFSEIVMEFLAG